jgi:hypothetical protein
MLNVLNNGEQHLNDIAMMVKVQCVLLELLVLFLLKQKKKKVFVVFFFFVESNGCFTSQTTFYTPIALVFFFFSFCSCNCMLTWIVIGHLCWKGEL